MWSFSLNEQGERSQPNMFDSNKYLQWSVPRRELGAAYTTYRKYFKSKQH